MNHSAGIDHRTGARTRALRAERNLALNALSGVSRAMLSRIKRGDFSSIAQLLVKICGIRSQAHLTGGLTLAAFINGRHPWGMSDPVDPKIRAIVERHLASEPNSRASKALRAMLAKGSVTTDDLNALGYNHPPRAIGDVRDAGIPVVTERDRTPDGRSMARYRLSRAEDIKEDRHGGRSTLPRAFKAELLGRYGSADCITGAKLDPRVLQIDHRIPYRVGGDAGLAERDASAYMLLDASSQRAKSWSCEHCRNFLELHDPEVCRTCFWAYPDDYQHIAMQLIRRTDIVWKAEDVSVHNRLKEMADREGISMSELLLRLARSGDQ